MATDTLTRTVLEGDAARDCDHRRLGRGGAVPRPDARHCRDGANESGGARPQSRALSGCGDDRRRGKQRSNGLRAVGSAIAC